MATQKRNVSEFNADVRANEGYRYTTNAPYSSEVANRRMTEAILSAIPTGAATLLDLGCGDGTYTQALQARLPGAACTGFDAASAAVEAARRKFPAAEFLVADLLDPATFPSRRFDVGVLRGVIHHLPDARAGIANAGRLTDTLVLVEPNGDNPILKWMERTSRYHIEHEEQSFSAGRLVAWCRESGWKVERISFIGFVPFFFPTWPARIIHGLQPWLERIPPLARYFSAQIVIVCRKA